ncbi:hypothetical protein ACSBR2_005632 [Camellia fascicularis]
MSLVSKAIVSWCKNHPNGNKDGEYDYASASTRMEGDGSNEDNDGDYDCAPAASWEVGDDDDDNGAGIELKNSTSSGVGTMVGFESESGGKDDKPTP